MDKYKWVDDLIAEMVANTPERDPAAAHRIEQWIDDQMEQLRRERDIK
jgi:hypothetical protein